MDIQGLLGNPMLLDFGMGLLSQSGPSPYPTSMGQAIGGAYQYANDRSIQRLQLEDHRAAIQERKDRNKAFKDLQGLLSNPAANIPAAIRAPDAIANEQSQMMGLLAQASPEAFTSAMVEQQFAQPSLPNSVREVAAVTGLQPGMPGFEEAFMQMQQEQPTALELAQLAQINSNMGVLAQDAQRDRDQIARDDRRRQSGSERSVNKINEIVDLLNDVEGTAAQPGAIAGLVRSGASITAGLQNLFGSNAPGAEKVATNIEKLGKKFSELSSSAIPDAFLGSDSRLEFFASQLPGVDLQIGSNLEILNSYLDGIIEEERIYNGINANTRVIQAAQKAKQRIADLVSGGQSSSPTPPPGFILE